MTVETALYPPQLNTSLPQASDMVSEGDDHIRLTKAVVKTTFPNFGGAINASHIEVNYLIGVTSGIQAQINSKGAIAGQTWSGSQDFTAATLTAATMPAGTSSAAVANTAFVQAAAFSAALPGQSGNANKFVKSDGANASWDYPYLTRFPVAATTIAASPGVMYCLQNSGATTLTLPNSPADGDVVGIRSDNLRSDNVILRNGTLLMGLAEDMTVDNPYFPVVLQYRNTYGWRLVA